MSSAKKLPFGAALGDDRVTDEMIWAGLDVLIALRDEGDLLLVAEILRAGIRLLPTGAREGVGASPRGAAIARFRWQTDPALVVDRLAEALIGLVDRLPELGDRLVGLCESPSKLFDIDSLPASGAGDLIIRLEPSDLLLELVAAAGASEGDLELIHRAFGHFESPVKPGTGGTVEPGRSP